MATKLVNGNFSRISDALDQVLKNLHSEGVDDFRDGRWWMRSRIKYSGDYQSVFKLYNSYNLSYSNKNTGKVTMITNTDTEVSENLRVNPLCDFANSTFNSDGLVGWCGHSKEVDTSDEKAGRIYITTDDITETDSLSNIKTVIWDAGKAVGTCKNVLETIDVREDITDGFCAFQEYALDTDNSGVPLLLYGFHAGIDGLTGAYEVILSNSNTCCEAIKNLKTGKLTYLSTTDARYNLVPSNFSGAVSLGDYIYYIGCDGYIRKVNKSTFAVEVTSSYGVDSIKDTLFSDGNKVYYCYYNTSGSGSMYYELDLSDLSKGSSTYIKDLNVPVCVAYNSSYLGRYALIHSIDNNTKFVLYNKYSECAVVFTDLSDIAGSILPEYTQFLVGGESFNLNEDGLNSFWVYNFEDSRYYKYDLGEPATYSLKVCKNTSGQVFASAQWETAYENTGAKQLTLNMYDTIV